VCVCVCLPYRIHVYVKRVHALEILGLSSNTAKAKYSQKSLRGANGFDTIYR
jgi:hypothetical protein